MTLPINHHRHLSSPPAQFHSFGYQSKMRRPQSAHGHFQNLRIAPGPAENEIAGPFTDSSKLSGTPDASFTPPTTPASADQSRSSENLDRRSMLPSRALKVFKPQILDYSLDLSYALGEGLWSTVYLALALKPSLPELTLPRTPRSSTDSSLSRPAVYAVKAPTRCDAKPVLEAEALINSQLSADPEGDAYTVTFHGLDPRNGALVMDCIPETLETFTSTTLAQLDRCSRKTKLVECFPPLALHLVSGLAWLHSHSLIHADIKPSNILLKPETDSSTSMFGFKPVYCDFSASFFQPSTFSDAAALATKSVGAGGGTWTFMAPELLLSRSSGGPMLPSLASDVYALGVTLLTVTIGGSPFATAGDNRFVLREMIKAGDVLGFATQTTDTAERLSGWEAWVGGALRKDAAHRRSGEGWRTWIEEEMDVAI